MVGKSFVDYLARVEHKRPEPNRHIKRASQSKSVVKKHDRSTRAYSLSCNHSRHRRLRTCSCPPIHSSMLLGLKPRQLNHRKKGDESFSLSSNLARVHDGSVAELTHSQPGAQCCCLRSPGRLGCSASRHSHGELLPNVFRVEAHGERERTRTFSTYR